MDFLPPVRDGMIVVCFIDVLLFYHSTAHDYALLPSSESRSGFVSGWRCWLGVWFRASFVMRTYCWNIFSRTLSVKISSLLSCMTGSQEQGILAVLIEHKRRSSFSCRTVALSCREGFADCVAKRDLSPLSNLNII